MINTEHKLKLKFLAVEHSKIVAFTWDHTKVLSFQANLTLKVKVKFTSFQTNLIYIDAR